MLVASELIASNRKMFSRIIAENYNITDWICEDYPKHHEHFWGKYVPGIFSGDRQIIACYLGNEIAGACILKKDAEEVKLSTLYVSDKYRGAGVATSMLEKAFEWLGTDRPLITIADYKVPMFEGIIKKYGWELTQVLVDGYYNDRSKEHVYNGKID